MTIFVTNKNYRYYEKEEIYLLLHRIHLMYELWNH